MSHLSREAILTVLSGLTVLGCDKPATVSAEPAASVQAAAAPASAASPAVAAAPAAVSAAGVAAKEVPSAQGAVEKEKTCSPGGCAPGQCGGAKK